MNKNEKTNIKKINLYELLSPLVGCEITVGVPFYGDERRIYLFSGQLLEINKDYCVLLKTKNNRIQYKKIYLNDIIYLEDSILRG